MVDRYFTKDLNLINTLTGFKDKDGNNVNAIFYNVPMEIVIYNWDNIDSINQGLMTTDLTAANYVFDHDDG